jgi:hypothetical protein
MQNYMVTIPFFISGMTFSMLPMSRGIMRSVLSVHSMHYFEIETHLTMRDHVFCRPDDGFDDTYDVIFRLADDFDDT